MTTAATPRPIDALEYGNQLRLAGARWRRELRAMPNDRSRIVMARVLEDRGELPPEIGALRLGLFLKASRYLPTRTVLLDAKIHRDLHSTRMRDLTMGERDRLAAALRESARRAKGV